MNKFKLFSAICFLAVFYAFVEAGTGNLTPEEILYINCSTNISGTHTPAEQVNEIIEEPNGNEGIKNSNPSNKLEIAGKVKKVGTATIESKAPSCTKNSITVSATTSAKISKTVNFGCRNASEIVPFANPTVNTTGDNPPTYDSNEVTIKEAGTYSMSAMIPYYTGNSMGSNSSLSIFAYKWNGSTWVIIHELYANSNMWCHTIPVFTHYFNANDRVSLRICKEEGSDSHSNPTIGIGNSFAKMTFIQL